RSPERAFCHFRAHSDRRRSRRRGARRATRASRNSHSVDTNLSDGRRVTVHQRRPMPLHSRDTSMSHTGDDIEPNVRSVITVVMSVAFVRGSTTVFASGSHNRWKDHPMTKSIYATTLLAALSIACSSNYDPITADHTTKDSTSIGTSASALSTSDAL